MKRAFPVTVPFAVTIALMATAFFVLGLLFVLSPASGAAIYGVTTQDRLASMFVRAVGLRDIALAAYLFGLMATDQQRALTVVLTATLVIPTGDLALLAFADTARPVHYLLHGSSLMTFAALALWSRRARRSS